MPRENIHFPQENDGDWYHTRVMYGTYWRKGVDN